MLLHSTFVVFMRVVYEENSCPTVMVTVGTKMASIRRECSILIRNAQRAMIACKAGFYT